MICTLTPEPSESLDGWSSSYGQSPEEAYHLLLNANPLPMWVYDLDTLRFLEVNDAALENYGYSREEFLSMSITDLRPVEEVSRLLEFSLLLQQGVPPRPGSYPVGIWRHRKKDGTPIDVEIIGTPLPYAHRRAVAILATDVTERLRSQAQAIEQTRMATLMAETGAALGSAVTLNEGLQHCAEILAAAMPAPFARVWTLTHADGVLELQAGAGAGAPTDQERIRVGVCRIGRIASEAKSHRTNSILEERLPAADGVCDPAWARSQGIHAFAGCPLIVEGRVIGVAAVYAHHALSDAAVQAFESVTGGIAQFIKRKRAETALRESDERIRLLLDSTAEAIMGVDIEGNCTFANQAALRMLGYDDAASLAGKNIHALAHHTHSNGDPFPEADCAIRRSILSGQGSHSDDEIFWRADGTSFPAEYSCYPVFKDGEVTGAVITFLDIIDRKHAEEEQRKLALLVESSDDFIVMASPGGKTIYINQGGCRMIGLDRSHDAIGADVSRFHTESAWAKIQEEVMPAATKAGQWHGEIQLRHWATGAPIDGLMNAFLVRRPETGEVLCMATVIRDITARKRAEEEQRKLAAVIENSNDFIGMASPEGRVLFVNPAGLKTLGVDHNDEVRGREILELVAPEDRDKFRDESLAALLRNGRSENEVRFVNRRTGAYVSMQQSNFFVTDPQSGQVLALATISRDISERKRVEEALRTAKDAAESANRLKSEFLANMSHEIRTPMNGILGMADLALDTELTGEQREYIEAVKLSADRLLTLLNGILDFSRIEAGKLSLQMADFDVHRMLEEILEPLRPDAAEKALEITCGVAREVPRMVRGDAGRLRQVVSNLVSNAIKFTQHGRVTLTVEAEQCGSQRPERTQGKAPGRIAEDFEPRELPLHVTVRDTGIGIPREKQQLIFEAFRQADGSMTRKFGGTGLGLAIASRLVERMGGRIWVESEVGAGSEFHFTVPLGKAAAPAVSPQNIP